MSRERKVLVVGAGSPNADMVAEVLNSYGIEAEWTDQVRAPNPLLIRKFDAVYGIYLQTCSRYILIAKILGKKTIVHFVGSDAYWVARERSIWRRAYWKLILRLSDVVLYVSPHLEKLTRRRGLVLPFPIATEAFRHSDVLRVSPERDILYYCPSGSANERIYRLSWIVEYAKAHPEEKITIIGNVAHPAKYDLGIPNVKVIPYVDRSKMPLLYKSHSRLIRMTTEDGLPRMTHEALLCGLKVTFNGQEVKDVPKEREPMAFASILLKILDNSEDGT